MSIKEGIIESEGVVTALLRDVHFKVKLDNGHELIAHTSGRIRRSKIRILVGDRVLVEISTIYSRKEDIKNGRIVRRLKNVSEKQPQ